MLAQKRTDDLSDVAGILDPFGGLRVVVAKKQTFHNHLRGDEMIFVVPNFQVQEPVPWNLVPYVIRTVELHIAEWIRTRNDPDMLGRLPIKMYLIRSRPTDANAKRSLDLDSIVQ